MQKIDVRAAQGDDGHTERERDQIERRERSILTQNRRAGNDTGAARAQACACWSNASIMDRALSKFSGVRTASVFPLAISSRASKRVCGKCSRTRSRSCKTASTVRWSSCHADTTEIRSATVLESI